MMNIILVDDDVLALTKLKDMIRQKNLCVAGEFTQPEEAAAFLKEHEVHILITDMKMPRIDGIELMRTAKKYCPQIEIIAISSYKDFDYVKDSFKEGSIDYILKHKLDSRTLNHALSEAVARIRQNGTETVMKEAYLESKKVIKEKIMGQFFREELTESEAKDAFLKYQMEIDVGSTVLLVCEIDDYAGISKSYQAEDKRIFLNAVRSIMEKVAGKVSGLDIIAAGEGRYVILLSYQEVKSQLYMYSMSTQYVSRLNDNIRKMLNVELSIGVGAVCQTFQELKLSYHKCMELLSNKFFEGKGKIYSGYGQVPEKTKESASGQPVGFQSSRMYQKLMSADNSCIGELESIFQNYKVLKYTGAVIELSIIEMLNTGYKAIQEKGLQEIQHEKNFQVLYSTIKQTETLDEVKEIVKAFYREIMDGVNTQNDLLAEGHNKYTKQTVSYIRQHYKEVISLQDIADTLGVHYAYLSKLFKEDTGSNFSEYLNKLRIEKAKELIESKQYKIKEVYSEVGFNQYNYFFKVFKQVEGCTPTEYERKY